MKSLSSLLEIEINDPALDEPVALRRETEGVECRKDAGVLDEAPSAYKNIEAVMEQQEDLVEVVAELKQVLCVKG